MFPPCIATQEPLLFRGTVRENLDPSGDHTDAALWEALRSCNLTATGGCGSDSGGATCSGSAGAREVEQHDLPGLGRRKSDAGGGVGTRNGDGINSGVFHLETQLDGHGLSMSAGERS